MIEEQSPDHVRRRGARGPFASWRSGRMAVLAAAWFSLAFGIHSSRLAHADALTAHQQLAVDIYKELVEINTVSATGDTGRAAEAMAVRLRAAGFGGTDVQVFKP